MMRFRLLFLLIVSLFPAISFSQINDFMEMSYLYNGIHRPAGLDWQEINTPHFRIIFPNGEDSLAYRSAAILESEYAGTSSLTGGSLKNFPVILNNYNDVGNGYVSSVNFRSEIELAFLKGKGMNPQTGGWLETVLPHELVHAMHFNVQQPFKDKKLSLSNMFSIFSPDVARSIHGMPPVGFHEGLAVYYETENLSVNGGRGNYPYFNNQFNANFGSDRRWNIGQTLISSDYTKPFDRHYLSGYSFVNWLEETYGEEFSKESIRYHYHYFMLGYGFTLKMKTGLWPNSLYKAYTADLIDKEKERLGRIGENTNLSSRIIETPYKGEGLHRPLWLSDQELLFYGAYYNARLGFYRVNLENLEFKLLKEAYAVGDYNYEIQGGNRLYYSRFNRDPFYTRSQIADVETLDLDRNISDRLTKGHRVFAPTTNGLRTLALQTHGTGARIVELKAGNKVEVLKEFSSTIPITLRFNPRNQDELAVILRKGGVQALWVTTLDQMEHTLNDDPSLAFKDGSIFDPQWHPEGDRLLISADPGSAMNIYEYMPSTGTLTQVTNSLYNAYEGSYSPDGEKIAYILQQAEESKIAILKRNDFFNKTVSDSLLLSDPEFKKQWDQKPLGSSSMTLVKKAEKKPYRAGISWLKPRAIYPVVTEKGGTYQYGAGFSSIDALSRQAYSAEITGIQDRLWYDLNYSNTMFYPGFRLKLYSDPLFTLRLNENTNGYYSLMRQDRGASLTIPFNYIFRGDTRYSALLVQPGISAEQFKFYDLNAEALSDFTTQYRSSIFSQLSLGVLNLRRDIQPSEGIAFFGLIEKTLNDPKVVVNYPWGSREEVFRDQWAAYYGVFGFLSPLRKWNQSLRLDLNFLQQSSSPIYSNNTIKPMGFDPNAFLSSSKNGLARVSAKYLIPLYYADTGALTLPFYLSSVYMTTFAHSITDLDSQDLLQGSRSIYGAGLHVQFKISNIPFDLGVGLAYEPTRNHTEFIFGQF